MTPRATAHPRRFRRAGRRSRSRGCVPISSAKKRGAKRRRKRSRPSARRKSRRRSNGIWRPRRARLRRCSIISTPSCREVTRASERSSAEMPELTLVEAINLALARAMEEDANVVVLGEDVGVNGGVFRATVGLQQRFGAERVIDTPLAELLISGLCVGMAAQGLRPVGEIQFMGFLYPCIDQLVNHASRLRNRTQGRLSCPMVLRTPHGGGIRAPEHHSESTEAMLAHIPGLRV